MRNISIKKIFIVLLLALTLVLSSCSFLEELADLLDAIEEDNVSIFHEDMLVHFIDVGQGDSILIQMPSGQNMLIDAGDNNQGKVVVDYLKKQGVRRVDYLVGTHPHADHIGGLDDVIDEFDIGDIYMPKVIHTTKTYMDVLEAIDRKNLKIKAAKAGMTIPLEDARAEIIGPDSELKSDNLNDYSIVIRLTYGKIAFLFQGDAEKKTEDNILKSGKKVKADVIKLGHHGSTTSNTTKYIEAVDPDYAVITLAEGNKYGHPHKEIIALMEEKGITVYRTDRDGDIVVITDGEQVSFAK